MRYIAVGMAADMFLIDTRRAELAGAVFDAKNMLCTVGLKAPVDMTIINGRMTVDHGRVCTLDEDKLSRLGNAAVRRYLGM